MNPRMVNDFNLRKALLELEQMMLSSEISSIWELFRKWFVNE